MFVYTFENIGIIKNLKHSDSIKPKHKKRIDSVKGGMFADFDYSELKLDTPPKNESLKTHQELTNLQRLPEDVNFVKEMDTSTEKTLIGFENELLPELTIPESIGAHLHLIKLKNFQNDVLLVNAKLKDTNFNEYYVFVWKDSLWKQPVKRFNIHKSNMTDTLVPIRNNPEDSTLLLRYYSVFVMDRKSEKKFTWKLMSESVPIEE